VQECPHQQLMVIFAPFFYACSLAGFDLIPSTLLMWSARFVFAFKTYLGLITSEQGWHS
jgi:hypothetical protein